MSSNGKIDDEQQTSSDSSVKYLQTSSTDDVRKEPLPQTKKAKNTLYQTSPSLSISNLTLIPNSHNSTEIHQSGDNQRTIHIQY